MASIESVFNHLVLPAKIAGGRDVDQEALRQALVARLLRACVLLKDRTGGDWAATWESTRRCLDLSLGVDGTQVETQRLLASWARLRPGEVQAIYLAEQNASLLVRRDSRQVFPQTSSTIVSHDPKYRI